MTTPPRPDQEIDPPAQVIAPGGNAGIFRGRLIIVNGVTAPPGSGIFIYDNTGALIGAWVGAAGTDPVDAGSVSLGLTVQNPSGTVVANLQSGALQMERLSGAFAPPFITITDATITAGTASGTDVNAAGIVTPIIQAVTPGDNTGGAETWHSLGSPSATGFSSDYGRYRMSPEGEVEFDIQLSSAGGGTGGTYTYANTLPTAYRPVNIRVYPLCRTDTAPGGQFFPCLQVHASGAVQIQVPGIAAGNQVGGQAFMPLD